MNPDEKQELLNRIARLESQLAQFLNAAELDPLIVSTIQASIDNPTIESTGNTTGILKSVDESGVSSYSVAKEYDGSVVIEDADGNQYKLGYYNV